MTSPSSWEVDFDTEKVLGFRYEYYLFRQCSSKQLQATRKQETIGHQNTGGDVPLLDLDGGRYFDLKRTGKHVCSMFVRLRFPARAFSLWSSLSVIYVFSPN